MPECPHCGMCTEAPVETKIKQTMNENKTPLTTLKTGDLIYILWADGVEVGLLESLEPYQKETTVWPYANVVVNYKGAALIRKIVQEHLFCTPAEANAEFIASSKRLLAALDKLLKARGSK